MSAAKAAGADLAEIRIDLLDPAEQPHWLSVFAARVLPVIVTNRASWEGGNAVNDEDARLRSLVLAVKLGVPYVDVELEAAERFREILREQGIPMSATELILSHHNFDRALDADEVARVQERMRGAGADIHKIAMMATSAMHNALVFDTLKNARVPTIMIAMGELGQVSRLAAARFGAFLTFASVTPGEESAPGQVDVRTLMQLYRFRSVALDTPMYGVIGNPVSHSASPATLNAAMSVTGKEGVYFPLKVEADVPKFIREMTARGFAGFSVTIPGKLAAMEAMDQIDDVARRIGAINSVIKRKDGTLKGFNTDWVAALSAVEEKMTGGMKGKRVLCIGAGGAGRALAFGALERGAVHVTIANRTKSKAEALAKDLGGLASGIGLEELTDQNDFDVIMNSTSVGMIPRVDDSPVDKQLFHKGMVVFDAVYNPLKTKMLKEAEEAGCVIVSGLEMFVRQAAVQFENWFPDTEAPLDTMRQVVLKRLGH